jgi:citrate lyase subunit beta / citryl-CoA lyase
VNLRSLLFVPATKTELLAKVPRWQPDVVVVDLEDAVPDAEKDAARLAVADADFAAARTAVLVRVNPPGTPWHELDIAACLETAAAGIVLPKGEDPEAVAGLVDRLADAAPDLDVVLGIESAIGVARARELLATGIAAGFFGSEDFLADMGGRRTATGVEVLYARSEVVLAGRLAAVPMIDQAVVAVGDDAAFTADAETGRALGYVGKICVHPRQVALAHAAFTPGEAEVAEARRVLERAAAGVGVVDGLMVDAVHMRVARQVLERAGQAHETTEETG